MAREDPNVRVDQGECNYRLVADHLTYELIALIEKLRKALEALT